MKKRVLQVTLLFFIATIIVVSGYKLSSSPVSGKETKKVSVAEEEHSAKGLLTAESQKESSDSLLKIFNRALTAFDSTKYNVAINLWHSTLQGFYQEKDYENYVIAINNIGVAYNNMKRHELALDYFQLSLQKSKELKLNKYVDTYYDNLIYYYEQYIAGFKTEDLIIDAINYFGKEKDATLLEKYELKLPDSKSLLASATAKIKALEQEIKTEKNKAQIAESYKTLGDMYSYTGDFLKAKESYLESVRLAKESNIDSTLVNAMTMMVNLDMLARHLKDPKYKDLWKVSSTETENRVFFISDINYITADSLIATVFGGSYDNMVPGSEVNVWACVYPELPDHDVFSLGKGRVLDVGDYKSKIGIKLFDGVNKNKKLFIVDHAYIPVARKTGYTSPLLDVAKSEIIFRDNSQNILYSYGVLNYLADPSLDAKILEIFLADYPPIYGIIDDLVKEDPAYQKPAETGEFKGLTVDKAIRKSDVETVKHFLYFIKDFPAKYLGLSFKFIESYFSWISSDAIAGQTKLANLILKANGEKDLRKIFEVDSISIADYDIPGKFADSTEDLYPKGLMDEAEKYSLAATLFADWLKNNDKIKRVYLARGLYLKAKGDMAGTEYAYKRSLEYARLVKDTSYIAMNQHNLGILYSDLEQYEKSIAYYDSCLAIRKKMVATEPSDWLWERLGGTYWGKAYSLAGMDKYKESVEFYELALASYDSSKGTSVSDDKLTVLRNIADVYSKMGNYQKSLDIYKRVHELSLITGNKKKQAQNLFDMGYTYFELGEYQIAIENYTKSYNLYLELEDLDNAGLCQSNIGQALWNLGKFDDAIKAHNKAIEHRIKTGNLADQAFSYSKIGSLYSKQGDPGKAMEYFDKAVELYKSQNDEKGMAEVYDNIGAMYKYLKDFEKTFDFFNKSLAIKEKSKDKYAIAENWFEQGLAYMTFNDVANATTALKKSLELNLLVNDKLDAIYCMINLGQLQYGYRNNFDTALVIFNSALKMAKEISNNSPIAYCYKQIGLLYSETGGSAISGKYLDSALAIYESMQEKAEIGNVLINLGSASIAGGEFDKALGYFLKAEAVAKEMNNNNLLGDVYLYKGDLNRVLGEYKKAQAIFDTAYSYYDKIDNPWALASIFISYGNIYNSLGEYQLSIDNYSKSDSIYKSLENDYYRATPLNNMGTVYFWQGDYAAALPYFQKSLSILDSLKYFGDFRATVLSNIGEVLYEQKKYDEAEKFLIKSIEHAKKTGAKTYLTTPYGLLASLYIDTKKTDLAEKYAKLAYDLSTELKDRNDLMYSSLVLGRLNYMKNDFKSSNKFLDNSIKLSQELGTNKLVYHSFYYKALNFQQEKNQDSSISYLRKAVNVLSDIRGKLVGGDKAAKLFSSGDLKVKIYEALINAFIQKGQLDSALYYLDMSYNEGLKEQFGNVTPKFDDKNQNEAIEKEKELKNKKSGLEEELQKEKSKPAELRNNEKIASLEASLEVAENSYVEFIMQTVQKNPGLDDYFKDNINPVSFLEWQEFIPDDVAVLAYLMGDNNLYIFGATSDTVGAVVMNIKKDELEQKLVEFYSMLKDSYPAKEIGEVDPDTYSPKNKSMTMEDEMYLAPQRKLAMELYQMLVQPVKSIFKGKKKLCVVPFGKLYYLPFETLISSQPGEKVKFLLEDHLLFYVTSFKVFSQNMAKETVPFKLIAFANADKSLPSSENEVNGLKKLFTDAEIYSKDDATEEKIRSLAKGQFNTLHLATHGNMNYGEITKSFLTMAKKGAGQDPLSDGQLTINEVWGLTNLRNYKLVTLSACKTAISEEFAKGWLVSPANAFLKIGVQTVVASLWQVEDEATSILMTEFYTNLKTMSKSEALQKAKLKLIKNPKYAFPYFWAPFIMVGDYR